MEGGSLYVVLPHPEGLRVEWGVRAWGHLLRHHNSLFHQDFFCPIISGAYMPKPLDSWHQCWAIAANFYDVGAARDCPQATGDGNGGKETRAELQSFLSTSSPTATSGHISRHPDFSHLPPTYTPNEDKLLSPSDEPQFCVVTIVLGSYNPSFPLVSMVSQGLFWRQELAHTQCLLLILRRTRKWNHKVQENWDIVWCSVLEYDSPTIAQIRCHLGSNSTAPQQEI